jgi:DNA-binding NarL/FixJ family response regulator
MATTSMLTTGTCIALGCSDQELRDQITGVLAAAGRTLSDTGAAAAELDLPADRVTAVILTLDGTPTRRAAAVRELVARGEHILPVFCHESGGSEVRRILATGARGFVLTSELDSTLVPTVDAVLAGQVVVPSQDRLRLARPQLSAREKQILGMVVMGYMNCDIANTLFLAESTVKSHLSSAFLKLGVRSRREAVELILDAEHGLGRGILAITADQPALAGDTPA